MRKLGMALKHPRISPEEQVRWMKKHGVEATFLPFFQTDYAHVMPLLAQNGIVCESLHAPWTHVDALWADGETGDAELSMLTDWIGACARYEVPTMVMHLASVKGEPDVSEIGLARFDRLMATADRLGVTVASENINGTKLLTHLLDRYPQMRFCWDVGHEPCFSGGVEFMPLFGHRIGALHLHDNHGVPGEDEHLLPYDGSLDMDRAARQLARSGYTGSIMLEYASTESFYAHLDADAFYARAAMQARKFADQVDFYQGK